MATVTARPGALAEREGLVTLGSEAVRLVLDAAHGGAVREFSWHGCDLFRPTPPGARDDPFDFACFPMVPYANRIADGRFVSGMRTVQLLPNWDGDPAPLHGQGWRGPWDIVDLSAVSAILRFDGGGDAWPWLYRAEQHFELLRDGFFVTLAVENRSNEAMPAMLGLHPYFPNASRATLRALLPQVWTMRQNLPVEQTPTPDAWSFRTGRWADAVPLDHCFSGWDGVAKLAWADRSLFIRAKNCSALHIYAPPGKSFFCLEPQTAAAGALNRGDVTILAPGEQLAMQVSFSASAL